MRPGRFRPPSTSSELGRSRPSSHAISPDLEQVRDVQEAYAGFGNVFAALVDEKNSLMSMSIPDDGSTSVERGHYMSYFA